MHPLPFPASWEPGGDVEMVLRPPGDANAWLLPP